MSEWLDFKLEIEQHDGVEHCLARARGSSSDRVRERMLNHAPEGSIEDSSYQEFQTKKWVYQCNARWHVLPDGRVLCRTGRDKDPIFNKFEANLMVLGFGDGNA